MADNFLTYTIRVNKDTGAIEQVKQALGEVEKKGKQVGGTFSSIGGIVKTLGIAGFLLQTARTAAMASESMDDLNSEWMKTVGVLVKALEPALALVSRGLQGLLIMFQGTIKAISALVHGKFGEAAELMADAIVDAGERARGATAVMERDISKIILQETQTRLKDTKMSGEEKLRIIDEYEKKALKALEESAEFSVALEDKRNLMRLEIQKQFAAEREAATREEERQAKEAEQRRLEAERQANEERLALSAGHYEMRKSQREVDLQDTELSLEERMAIINAAEEDELRILREAHEIKKTATEIAEMELEQIRQRYNGLRRDAREKELDEQKAFFGQLISSSAAAAATEYGQSKKAKDAMRALAAQGVKDLADSAAREIVIAGAAATAKAYARGGGFPTGIPFAVATAAFYATLAATVAAAGGVAAQKIAPPSGGGAMETRPGEGPLGTPVPVAPVNPIGTGTIVGEEGRPVNELHINTLGWIPPELMVQIEELEDRRSAR